jgi:hypothetical protein
MYMYIYVHTHTYIYVGPSATPGPTLNNLTADRGADGVYMVTVVRLRERERERERQFIGETAGRCLLMRMTALRVCVCVCVSE